MKYTQLYKNGCEIIASDGKMIIDARLNVYNAELQVIDRNKRYGKNFPHKVCDAFNYKGKIIQL